MPSKPATSAVEAPRVFSSFACTLPVSVPLFVSLALLCLTWGCSLGPGADREGVALSAITAGDSATAGSFVRGEASYVWLISAAASRRCNDYLFFVHRAALYASEASSFVVTDDPAVVSRSLELRSLNIPVLTTDRHLDPVGRSAI